MRVMDFGLARVDDDDSTGSMKAHEEVGSLTQTGALGVLDEELDGGGDGNEPESHVEVRERLVPIRGWLWWVVG